MRYIDTHAHLYDSAFGEDLPEVIQRALDLGVYKILLPDVDSSTREAMINLSNNYPELCFPMVGVHPTSINEMAERWREEVALVAQELETNPSRYIAVGEIGLDLYWSQEFIEEQKEALRIQIELALQHSLPVAIHVRDAWEQITDLLTEYKGRGLRGVIHAFSGSIENYRTIKECGEFLFAIGGVVTFKKSKIAEVVAEMDLCDLLLETDAPYLTPTPHRGKRNESSYIPLIAQFIAQIKGVTTEEVARITVDNTLRMFDIM